MNQFLFISIIYCCIYSSSNDAYPRQKIDSLNGKTFIWDESSKDVWTDSLSFNGDSLTVYKDEGYGYGRIITFQYSYRQISNNAIVLEARSMNPEGIFVLKEQYEWHKDTLQLIMSNNQIRGIEGSQNDRYLITK